MIVTAWCHRCGKYVPAEIVRQNCKAPLTDEAGACLHEHDAALIQCKPHHHALLSVGLDDHVDV